MFKFGKSFFAAKRLTCVGSTQKSPRVEFDGSDHYAKNWPRGALGARKYPSVLIIGDSRSPPGQRQFASQIPGAITVEAVDLRDLVTFAQRFDLNAQDALDQLAQFAESVMANIGAVDFVTGFAC